MKIIISTFAILTLIAASAFGALPTTADLIPAWENYIKSRPDTAEFTKIGNGVYKFKSKKFDYDGSIKIVDTLISDAKVQDKDFKAAIIQIELPGLSQENSKKISYQAWRQNVTMFMFDVEKSKWLNYEEYGRYSAQEFNKNRVGLKGNDLSFYDLLILVLAVLFIYAVLQSKKYTKSMREQYQQALRDSREQQQEVINELKKANELLAKLLDARDGESS